MHPIYEKLSRRSSLSIACMILLALVRSVGAQALGVGSNPGYDGALLYKIPLLTSLPPAYPGQPLEVSEAFLLFDKVMRLSNCGGTDHFFERMVYGDTSRYVANLYYRVDHDDPIALYQWLYERVIPDPYLCSPGYARRALLEAVFRSYPDSDMTRLLLVSDIIARITIIDTFNAVSTTSKFAPRSVLVTARLMESIKGKKVLLCPNAVPDKKGDHPIQNAPAILAQPIPADSGVCFMFEYSPDWSRLPLDDTRGPHYMPLADSISGTWIKPDSGYLVFLRLENISVDQNYNYFSIYPTMQGLGTSACMYPIHTGLVQNPNNDFGLGTSTTVEDCITEIRKRIYTLTTP